MGADNFDPTIENPAIDPAAKAEVSNEAKSSTAKAKAEVAGIPEIDASTAAADENIPNYAGNDNQCCMFADICEDEGLCRKLQRDEEEAKEIIAAKKKAAKKLCTDLINKQYDEIAEKWLEFLENQEPAIYPYERKFVYTVNGATKIFEKVSEMLAVLGLKVAGTTIEGSVTF